MKTIQCKIVSALIGAIIAGAIAIVALIFLVDYPGIDLLVAIIGIIVGAALSIFLQKKLCSN
jgi:membrane associated rhomboid family serine protease